jgi:type I restriction enzyme S subunit
MKEIPFLIPSPEEQTAISQFLDRKTALIDKAIAIKQRQIELLKERRQILIHRAVTRGLNPNVKMKDSGVEWIGEIPEGWEVVPGFRIFREVHRKNIGLIEENVLSLSYGKIIVKPIEKLVGLVPESFETYQIVEAGEIIVRCTDLQNDQTSLRTGLVTQRGIITSAYLNLKVNNSCQPEYYHWFLHALDVTKVLYKFGSGLRQNLSFNDFKRMPIVALPKSEQLEISAFCNDLTNRVDSAISSKEKEIHQLKEYKATLINSAVTGKIKAA